MRLLLLLLLCLQSVFSMNLKPIETIKMQGAVIDLENIGDRLYIGTDAGKMSVYDITQNKIVKTITLEKIHDFMDDLMPPKIYSVDAMGDKILLLSEGENGVKNLFIEDNGVLKKVLGKKDHLTMSKAKFIDKDHVFIGLLSNEVLLYDLKNKKIIYQEQLSQSKFSDFALNEDKTKAVIACESGINYLIDTKTGKHIRTLEGANKDNVFKIAYKNGRVATAGQDRIGAVYRVKDGSYIEFHAPFLIYSVGLNHDASLVAFAFNDNNDIAIFRTDSSQRVYTLIGQKSTMNTIIFYDKKTMFSSSDDKYIMKWRLK
ncbi:WD40 repeat domain-containing protein [Sulfurospirillum sp. 1612]|uniref:WD40 repeat domain-containing protein n=1 Tax=Sulfurospirillum sp. 1612 TaxID=3094835 RepID=UPI002F929129